MVARVLVVGGCGVRGLVSRAGGDEMTVKNGGPAFSSSNVTQDWDTDKNDYGRIVTHVEHGMTLRDYFAAKAMAALLGDAEICKAIDRITPAGRTRASVLAETAYDVADMMLEQREVTK